MYQFKRVDIKTSKPKNPFKLAFYNINDAILSTLKILGHAFISVFAIIVYSLAGLSFFHQPLLEYLAIYTNHPLPIMLVLIVIYFYSVFYLYLVCKNIMNK